jgi:hypothetical protein
VATSSSGEEGKGVGGGGNPSRPQEDDARAESHPPSNLHPAFRSGTHTWITLLDIDFFCFSEQIIILVRNSSSAMS